MMECISNCSDIMFSPFMSESIMTLHHHKQSSNIKDTSYYVQILHTLNLTVNNDNGG